MLGQAVGAAVSVARGLGLRVDEPVVLRDLTNVLIRLDPSPLVARVPQTLSRLRGPGWFELEVRVVSWLARAGAPVAPPASVVDPGPHERDGFLVSFWDVIDHDEARFDPAAAGRTLRDLHAALASCPEELPAFHRLDEIDRLLDLLRPSSLVSQRRNRGDAGGVALLAAKPVPPLRPIHGDAHLRNLLWTPEGPRLERFRESLRGTGRVRPRLHQLARSTRRCRGTRRRTVRTTSGSRDAMEPYVALFLAPWTLTIAETASDSGRSRGGAPARPGGRWSRASGARDVAALARVDPDPVALVHEERHLHDRPVSSVAGFVTFETVSPLTPGWVSVTASSTAEGSCTPAGRPSTVSI